MTEKGESRAGARPWRDRFLAALAVVAPPVLFVVLSVLARTLRIEIEGLDLVDERWRRGERVILAFWHGRLIAMAIAVRRTAARVCILVSRHRDGEIATQVMRRWGVETVRGSATRGGAIGFRGLVRAYERGLDLAVVPDGPRGPRCVAKPGVAYLARTTGAVVIPVGAAASRAWQLGSWDRMIVPKPFARLLLIAGSPLSLAPDADDAAIEAHRLAVAAAIDELTAAAESRVACQS